MNMAENVDNLTSKNINNFNSFQDFSKTSTSAFVQVVQKAQFWILKTFTGSLLLLLNLKNATGLDVRNGQTFYVQFLNAKSLCVTCTDLNYATIVDLVPLHRLALILMHWVKENTDKDKNIFSWNAVKIKKYKL